MWLVINSSLCVWEQAVASPGRMMWQFCFAASLAVQQAQKQSVDFSYPQTERTEDFYYTTVELSHFLNMQVPVDQPDDDMILFFTLSAYYFTLLLY